MSTIVVEEFQGMHPSKASAAASPSSKSMSVRTCEAHLQGGQPAEELASRIFLAQTRLWNALVEIDHEARFDYLKALEGSDTQLAALMQQAEQHEQRLLQLVDMRHQEDPSHRPAAWGHEHNTFHASLRRSRAALQQTYEAIHQARLRAEDAAKPRLLEIEAKRRARVQALAEPGAAGLLACHSESTLFQYKRARAHATRSGTQLEFRRFEGDGFFRVRLPDEGHSSGEPLPVAWGTASACGASAPWVRLAAGLPDPRTNLAPSLTFSLAAPADLQAPRHMVLRAVTARRTMAMGRPAWQLSFMFSKANAARTHWRFSDGDGAPTPPPARRRPRARGHQPMESLSSALLSI